MVRLHPNFRAGTRNNTFPLLLFFTASHALFRLVSYETKRISEKAKKKQKEVGFRIYCRVETHTHIFSIVLIINW